MTPFTPKQIRLTVSISGKGNLAGPTSYAVLLSYGEHEKKLEGGFKSSLPTRAALHGIVAGLRALKSSCEVTVVVQNELIVNAFEKGWILGWQEDGLLGRKTTKIKHTDLYAKVLDAMDGHAVVFKQPTTFEDEKAMERCKKAAVAYKKSGVLVDDVEEFPGETLFNDSAGTKQG